MALSLFRRRARPDEAAHALYLALVAQARQPAFFRDLGVPDTLDGRFDMVALHAFLVLHRLRGEGPAAAALGQRLFDVMFADMDQALRELGVGDLSVGKKIKAMASAFYGRIAAYQMPLEAGDRDGLAEALRRNLFRGAVPARVDLRVLAAYMREQCDHLAGQPIMRLLAGEIAFLPPPAGGSETRESAHGGNI